MKIRTALLGATLLLAAGAATTANAHDWRNHYATEVSYRVQNVTRGDVLNMRSGPGVGHRKIGALRPGQGGILIETCANHARWCRVSDGYQTGWVNMRYLGGYAD